MKVAQVWIGGSSPPAVLAQADDGSLWILEAKVSDVGMRALGRAASLMEKCGVGLGDHIDYVWRRLPDLGGGQ